MVERVDKMVAGVGHGHAPGSRKKEKREERKKRKKE